MRPRPQKWVYVAEAENGMVKIGFAGNPQTRVRGICGGSPIRVRLVAAIPATSRKEERVLHVRFARFRAWNEWFWPADEMLEFVNRLRGVGVPRVVEWSEIVSTFVARKEQSRIVGARIREAWKDPAIREQRLKAMNQGREFSKRFSGRVGAVQ